MEHLELKDDDVAVIAELIHNMIVELVPNWKPLCENLSSGTDHLYNPSEAQNGERLNCHWSFGSSDFGTKAIYEGLGHPQLVDGEDQDKQESVSSDISAEYGITVVSDSKGVKPDCFILHECCEGSIGLNSNPDVRFCGQEDGSHNQSENSADSLVDSCCSPSKNFDMSRTCSLTPLDKDHLDDLQLELEAIETRYQQCFRELVNMKEEAIESVKKRWMTKKNISVM